MRNDEIEVSLRCYVFFKMAQQNWLKKTKKKQEDVDGDYA